ncbi:hypothetical protein ACTOB_006655 [Actinoplanes oblitus]|uniref:Uncharacterized protein n=1 Tax=Actinoplanes oblitus TaxID=3040509 RepID=A0ABY8W9Y7_9ACTN|nr:hypothetical protein [Actinoplanes oblitus]WIM94615.1 hypothetical protein ACTOB_006655 [Actinoplanes oblitus]
MAQAEQPRGDEDAAAITPESAGQPVPADAHAPGAETDPGAAEEQHTEPPRPERAKTEQPQAEPVKPESPKPEPVKVESLKAEPVRVESPKTEPVREEPVGAEAGRAPEAPAEPVEPLSPEMIALLKAATANRDRPAAPPGDNSVTRILPALTGKAVTAKAAEANPAGEKPAGPQPAKAETSPPAGARPATAEAAPPAGVEPVTAKIPLPVAAEPASAKTPAPPVTRPDHPIATRGGTGSGRTARIWASWTRRTWVTAGGIAAVLLLAVGWLVGGSGGGVPSISDVPTGDLVAPPAPATSASPAASVAPRAATRPVRTATDLDQVCGSTYFPAAPKFRGKAPHPMVISVRDRLDLSQRSTRTLNRFAYGSKLAQRTWAPPAAKAQLVACLDLIGGGAKLKDCAGDGRTKLPLKVGRYRLSLYEVATRRKVAEVTLAGAEKDCPWVVMTGSDPTLYTTVNDNQLYRALRPKVTR